jgi:hypothetical protein
MSVYKIQTPGNYQEENIKHLEQGESLKTRISSACCVTGVFCKPFKVLDVEDLKLYDCLSRPNKMVNCLIKSC